MLIGLCNSKIFPSSVTTNLQPSSAKYDSETFEYSLFFHLHWLATAITLLDFSTHIQLIFLPTFLISAIHPSHCHQKTVLKLLVIYIKITNYSPSKNKMHFSPHGTQNIKNWSQLFFFFSSASFIATPSSIIPPLHHLFQFEGWINQSFLWTILLCIYVILMLAGISLPLDILEVSL